ncbi:MAG: hypothetical protein M0P13_10110 [Fibrobacteraceae bacterium]|nr:hypothetical protein [Fibrobacteraceae bacterium]
MNEIHTSEGFTEKRTVQSFGVLLFVTGLVILSVGLVAGFAEDFARDVLNMAFARYANATGRFALHHFAEDQTLMGVLQSLENELLPLLAVISPLFLVVGFAIAVFGIGVFAYPRFGSELLVSFHVLKRVPGVAEASKEELAMENSRGFKVTVGVFVALALIAFGIHYMHSPSRLTPQKASEVSAEAVKFYSLEKDFYFKNSRLGTWDEIGYKAPESDYFIYGNPGVGLWNAKNKNKWERCPEKSKWRVQFKIEGTFKKELSSFASSPRDEACFKLTPNFKKIPSEN